MSDTPRGDRDTHGLRRVRWLLTFAGVLALAVGAWRLTDPAIGTENGRVGAALVAAGVVALAIRLSFVAAPSGPTVPRPSRRQARRASILAVTLLLILSATISPFGVGPSDPAVQTVSADVESSTFNQSYDVSTEDTIPDGVVFNDDGTKMFVVGNSNNAIYEYELSTPFNVSSASVARSHDVSSEGTAPYDIAFNDDGTKMFVVESDTRVVNQYALSTGYNISTASLSTSYNISDQESGPRGLAFNDDGSKMYVVGEMTNDAVYEYELSTNFDVSTATFNQSLSVSTEDTSPNSIRFNDVGSKMLIVGNADNNVYEYDLSADFDISSASYTFSYNLSGEDTSPRGLAFNDDGSKMYIAGASNDNVYEYDTSISGFESSADLRGRVVDQHGDPVANAVVQVKGVEYANFTGDITQIQNEIDRIEENITNATPTQWDPKQELHGVDSLSHNAYWEGGDVQYALAHSRDTWTGGTSIPFTEYEVQNPRLAKETTLTFDTDEAIILSLWNADGRSSLPCEDSIDSDFIGGTGNGTVIVNQLGAGGEPLSTHEAETKTSIHAQHFVCNSFSEDDRFSYKEHKVAVLDGLEPGFYQIHAKGHPEWSYTIAVAPDGDVDRLRDIMKSDLRDKRDQLEARAQALEDYEANNKLKESAPTTRTNATGHFSMNFTSTTDEVFIVAYKEQDGMPESEWSGTVPNRSEIRDYSESQIQSVRNDLQTTSDTDIGISCDGATSEVGAMYAPGETERVQIPDQEVEVETVKTDLPRGQQLADQLCYESALLDWLRTNGYGHLATWVIGELGDLPRVDLEGGVHAALRLAQASEDACRHLAKELPATNTDGECQGGLSDDDDDGFYFSGDHELPTDLSDASDASLQEWMDAAGSMAEEADNTAGGGGGGGGGGIVDGVTGGDDGASTIGDGTGDGSVDVDPEEETLTVEWTVPNDVTEANATVRLHYSNGTTTVLTDESEYVETVSRTGRDDIVRLVDYPLGTNDPASVRADLLVAGPSGVTAGDATAVNPTFNGRVPQLDAVRFSPLQPGPDQRVRVRAIPASDTDFGELKNVTVTHPNGTDLPTDNISQGRSSAFSTDGAGTYRVELEFTEPDGDARFTEVVRIEAGDRERTLPPTARIVDGPTGVYAVIGSALQESRVDVQDGGQHVRIVGVIGSDADVPGSWDVHTEEFTRPQDRITVTQLTRGDDRRTIEQATVLRLHDSELAAPATLYRETDDKQAIPRDGEGKYAIVTRTDHNVTIETYSDGQGGVTLDLTGDAGLIDRAWYRARLTFQGVPFVGAILPSGLLALVYGLSSAGLVTGGLLLLVRPRRRRRRR